MKNHSTCWHRAGAAICGFAILAGMGCEAPTKRDLLVFFFDGVPGTKQVQQTPSPEDLEIEANKKKKATTGPVVDVAEKGLRTYVHAPYENRQCEACHESKFSQKMRSELRGVCLACHQNLMEKAKFTHAPAESGDCQSCHEPHESKQRFLLVRAGQQLCLECHDQGDMVKVAGHKTMGTTDCQQCHDPHKGDDKFFLKKLPNKPVRPVAALP